MIYNFITSTLRCKLYDLQLFNSNFRIKILWNLWRKTKVIISKIDIFEIKTWFLFFPTFFSQIFPIFSQKKFGFFSIFFNFFQNFFSNFFKFFSKQKLSSRKWSFLRSKLDFQLLSERASREFLPYKIKTLKKNFS